MPELHLMRHAKASWQLAGELDFERDLVEQGVEDAKATAAKLTSLGIDPDLVICSSARRTRSTLKAISTAIGADTTVEFDDAVYQATAGALLELVRSVDPGHRSVLMIGHNPSIHDFALELASRGDQLERLAAKFPTSAFASLSFDGEWASLGPDGASLDRFVRPGD